MERRRPLLVLALLLLPTGAALGACEAMQGWDDDPDRPFYQGRTLELLIPFGAGGGTDTWARMVAPHLQRELGEGAGVQVVNVPGAMSMAGANEYALRRRPDGRTAFVSGGSTFFLYLLGEPMARFDFRDFHPIISSPAGGVVFVAPEMGIREPAALAGLDTPLIYGGISSNGNDLLPLLSFALLDLPVRAILGYGSKGETRVAFERGETDIEYQTMPAYLSNVIPLVEEGRAVPLFSFGILDEAGELVADPEVPELPTVRDVYRSIHGEEPSGVMWDAFRAVVGAGVEMQKVMWLHGDAPPRAVEELREAVVRMVADPRFQADAEAVVGNYPLRVAGEAAEAFRLSSDVSPEALEFLREFAARDHGRRN